MMGLTEKQMWVYMQIQRGIQNTGRAPGYRTLARKMRMGVGSVYDVVDRIIQRGRLVRTHWGVLPPERVAYFRFDDQTKQLKEWPDAVGAADATRDHAQGGCA